MSGQSWSSVRAVSEFEEMNPSFRNTMEDAHILRDSFGGVSSQGLFGVFDGHGGREVVEFLAKNFEGNLLRELEHDGGSRSVAECFTSAYLITDIQTSKSGLTVSGSTAVTCLVREENNERVLHVANIGDSRAVLCKKDGSSVRLSFDHKASEPSEMKRVEDAGGFVLRKRVLGILSVSRSFGDHGMKKYVTARPFTTRTVLQEDDMFVILACDGVWDVMSDEEGSRIIHQALDEGIKHQDLAQYLVAEAIERGTTDNVTALVLML